MVFSKKDDFIGDGDIEGSDQENQSPDEVSETDGSDSGPSGQFDDAPSSRANVGREIGLAERLRDIFRDVGDGDLLLHQSDKENGVLQWLQALDLQIIGACRADERSKPLLKLNVSSGAAEDRLLVHLSQHFDAPEVGMLARCLCIPLVSIRVGKVIKKGNLFCPTATRGNLNLTLLPSSDLRLSFAGDDGCTERLSVLSSGSESSAVTIEDISADSSGRSFLIKVPGGQISYFWCSEKSKLIGSELLTKMKDLLMRKPSLSKLTGISESRLNCFATHLRADLLGSGSAIQLTPTVSSDTLLSNPPESYPKAQSVVPSLKSCSQVTTSQLAKSNSSLYQGRFSPKLNKFKDDLSNNSSSISGGAREKFKRRGESHCNVFEIDSASIASTSTVSASQTPSSGLTEVEKLLEGNNYCNVLPLSLPDALPFNLPSSFSPLSFHAPLTKDPASSPSIFSPYYCWCPPCSSTLQYTVVPHLPSTPMESLALPPLSSLLSAARSSSSLPNPPLDLAGLPSLDFPAFLPDPLAHIPLPVSSFVTMPISQQIPTFTPFMSDPIVHIPVIDVCSSGQGYLVSAGPTISTTITPLLPNLVNTLIPESESVLEKGARETLRLLMGSTQTSLPLMEMLPAALTATDNSLTLRLLMGSTQTSSPPLMELLPAALTTTDKSRSYTYGKKHSALVAGSRGLYSGTRDVDATANGISAMGLVSVPAISVEGDSSQSKFRRNGNDDLENWEDESSCMEARGKVSKADN